MFSNTSTLAARLADEGGWTDTAAVIDERTGDIQRHRDVHARAGELADEFLGRGIGPGDHVGFLVGDRPEWMPVFLALHAIGAVPLVVNPDLAEHTQSRMLGILPTKFVISYRDGALYIEGRESRPPAVHHEHGGGPEVSRYYLYSSGTTGIPKAVAHTSLDLPFFHDAVGGTNGLDIQATDTIVSLSQYYFTYGFNNQFVYPLFSGASVVLSRQRRDEKTFVDSLHQYGATLAFSVPSALAKLADHVESAAVERPAALRAVVSAGEPLPDAVAARLEDRWQVPVLNQIGSTEVGNAFCANGVTRRATGTAGFVCPGYAVQLRSDSGRPLPTVGSEQEVGAVWVTGPTIPRHAVTVNGTEELLVDGWLETKDIGYWADNGGLVVVGRTDDFVHAGGISMSAVEIESAIRSCAGVEDCAVLAPLVDGVSTLSALVVMNPSTGEPEESLAALRTQLRRHLDPFRVPKQWTPVPEIPRTGSGKIMRHKLTSVLIDGEPGVIR
ncbi:AMP-binding protein [Streptomyces sp. NBC_01433]|uniref:class I adenylate-forming enzyme family protein n=1 Tax=Streptomyces sp. NBC_01433 TaxID=2903864 RepID=UPI00224EE2DD|nr:AMP-binding protein [Streptomyces sp. NBC_01433]MCX4678967.1 AMP-binding protein [Streptomyces sp. NBC_01433]